MFERYKNMAMSGAILCLALCVNDIMSKVDIRGSSVYCIIIQPISALHQQRANQHGCTLGELKFDAKRKGKEKSTSVAYILIK